MRNNENSLDNDYIDHKVILWGSEFKNTSKKLKGGKLSAIVAASKIILTDSDMEKDTLILDVFAFWGSIELYIPKNWRLNVKCIPIMGYIGHKVISEGSNTEKNKTLILKGTVIMAAVEIKSL